MKLHPSSHWFSSARANFKIWIEPDAFLRYLPVIRWIETQAKPLAILEVGSGDFGLSTYLPEPIVKVDLKFSRASRPTIPKARGNTAKLPFKSGSFDLVFSVDLLEHLHPDLRLTALKEMVRVARKQVLAIFPCGEKSKRQDLELALEFQKRRNQSLDVLQAHEPLAFPEMRDIRNWEKCLARETKSWRIRKSFNLSARKMLIRGWLFESPRIISAIRFLVEHPIFLYPLCLGSSYRRIVLISLL